MVEDEERPGEERLAVDPAIMPADAGLVFIGKVRSPWKRRADCPRNLREAREKAVAMSGARFRLEVDEMFRAGLEGLEAAGHVIVLYWMHEARRDLIVQAPRHADEPRGVFALRSPVRPNPIALAVVKLLGLDGRSGTLDIDVIDSLDGTPLLDIKPYLASIDLPPG
jgi:tRNA-Thr(GGU) m(6)t(6)A37 methyltransferase TsaA